ncbi:MAG: phosphoribosylformylglycinamidine synthase subunit PurL, partial [Candidatus Odinarchaeia archaeon]
DVMWSEHCSYKSSRPVLKILPKEGPRVLMGPGQDAGVIDIGDGDAVAFKIETHNHPSAIEPYNGAATGIGGIIRDILCMGARPIALLDNLRFGKITSSHSKWLFEYVVKGISDYGNCIGVPTVAGDVEFDDSYENNCLVNVACVGLMKKEDIQPSEARYVGDILVLMGGSTGRDGIHGVTFASRVLTEASEADRPAVQIGDPFTKKLIIEATLEAIKTGYVRGLKDLGGGGLTCASSEMSGSAGTGVELHIDNIHLREEEMVPYEIMISESQERMLFVIQPEGLEEVLKVFDKYEVPYRIVGKVTDTGFVAVYKNGKLVAKVPSKMLSDPPTVERKAKRPKYLDEIRNIPKPPIPDDLEEVIYRLLSSPNLASKAWVYRQYDHEVGDRTIIKPGQADAAVMRIIGKNKAIAIKSDATPSHTFVDPYNGGAGSLAESCRNVVATGAEPLAWVDCLSFGNPENEEVFWTFKETVKGLADLGRELELPCVGGNVSFYNEDKVSERIVKPCPVVLTVGLIEDLSYITTLRFKEAQDVILLVGDTYPEMGGSEYYSYIHGIEGGEPPKVNMGLEKKTLKAVLKAIRSGKITAAHDCFRGGLATAIIEMGLEGGFTSDLNLDPIIKDDMRIDEIFFSESHSRFILTTKETDLEDIIAIFNQYQVPVNVIGKVTKSDVFKFNFSSETIKCSFNKLKEIFYGTIPKHMGVDKWKS